MNKRPIAEQIGYESCKQVDEAQIASDDALILLTVRIPAGLNFRERQGAEGTSPVAER
jgi:hypothetical protein